MEQCEGDATEPVNGVNTVDDSSSYTQAVRTY